MDTACFEKLLREIIMRQSSVYNIYYFPQEGYKYHKS